MPFQPINWASLPTEGGNGLLSFVDNFMKVYGAMSQAKQTKSATKAQDIANAMNQQRADQYPEELQRGATKEDLANQASRRDLGPYSYGAQGPTLNNQSNAQSQNQPSFLDALNQAIQKQNNPMGLSQQGQQGAAQNQQGSQNYIDPYVENSMKQAQLRSALQMLPLNAQKAQLENKFYPQQQNADITHQLLVNKFLPALTQSQIDLNKMGGRGMGVGQKADMYLNSLVQKDNPNLNENQLFEAANVLREGRSSLADGTPVKFSPETKDAYDRVFKMGTTSSLVNGNIMSAQAHAAIPVLQKYATKGLAPYGDTIANLNPQQIMDTFKNDKDSQTKLGDLIASQQLQFDLAQEYIRLSRAKPGKSITNELMDIGQQMINAKYPKLSQAAREESQKYLYKALSEANDEMMKVGIGASSATTPKGKGEKELHYNRTTGKFE